MLEPFRAFSVVHIQNGQSCLFWTNKWNQQPLQLQYPKLYSFARDKCITISKLFSHSHIENLFILPLSAEAFNQLQIVQSFIDHFPLTEQHDRWKSDWGDFSVSKAYKYLMGHRQVHQV